MSRRICALLSLGFTFLLVGCKGDERQSVVSNMIKEMGDTRRQMENIRTDLETATKNAKEVDEDGVKVVRLEKESAEGIKKIMKEVKEQTVFKYQTLQSKAKEGKPLTEEEKKAIAEANRAKLNTAIRELAEENEKLKLAFEDARKKDAKTTQELLDAFADAMGGLENIAQRK